MAPVELATGVWRIPMAPFDLLNAFLLADPDGSVTLVDAGLRRGDRRVLAALDRLGRRPGDVTRIVLTHAHVDHAGGLAATQRATGAEVRAHDREVSYLRDGRAPAPRRTRFAKVEVGEGFADGEVLDVAGGLTVVHTPGHSPGHCSFLHAPTGVLITGDALFNVRGLRYSPSLACTDVRLSRESAARLGELDFTVAAFTHGAHVSSRAPEAVRAFLAGRAS